KQAAYPLTLIFTAFFLALALNAPVHWIAQRLPGKRRGSRTAATAISFLVVILVLAGFLVSIVPPLVKQTTTFIQKIPELVEQTPDEDSSIVRFVARYELQDYISKLSQQLFERLDDVRGAAVSGAQRVGSSVVAILTVLVLT